MCFLLSFAIIFDVGACKKMYLKTSLIGRDSSFYFILSYMCLFHLLLYVFPLGSIEPPRFIKKLEPSKIVKQDESTRYECKIGGSPEIRVSWYKDETEIQESSKFRMSFLDSIAVLEMHHLSVEDSGDYSCEARNAAGSASSSTSLKVKGQLLPFFCVFHSSLPSSCPLNTLFDFPSMS